MDTITVNLTELYNLIRRMRKDDMAYVTLSILPPDEVDGEKFPASLNLEGVRSDEPDMAVDYESIDSVALPPPRGVISSDME